MGQYSILKINHCAKICSAFFRVLDLTIYSEVTNAEWTAGGCSTRTINASCYGEWILNEKAQQPAVFSSIMWKSLWGLLSSFSLIEGDWEITYYIHFWYTEQNVLTYCWLYKTVQINLITVIFFRTTKSGNAYLTGLWFKFQIHSEYKLIKTWPAGCWVCVFQTSQTYFSFVSQSH